MFKNEGKIKKNSDKQKLTEVVSRVNTINIRLEKITDSIQNSINFKKSFKRYIIVQNKNNKNALSNL